MKIRSLLLAFILPMLFLSAGMSTETPATTLTCPNEICVDSYNYCVAQCGNHQPCLRLCREEYVECQCANACGCATVGEPAKAQADSNVTAEVE